MNRLVGRMALAVLIFLVFTGGALAQTKIMFLGDSITRGVDGPSTDDAGFRNDVSDLLIAEGVSFDFVGSLSDGTGFDPNHEGHDGFRADQILASINTYLGANPDIIVLHIGTNDISNSELNETTRNEIGDIINAIHNFNPNIQVILCSLIPRTDALDGETTALNTLIEDLFYNKRDEEGHELFYAGTNEIFKQNATWATDYFTAGDDVHPNDTGYNILGQVVFDEIMIALNSVNDAVTDNFERTNLGITWDADVLLGIVSGELQNNSTDTGPGTWKQMAAYRSVKNPTSAAIKWSETADATGINEGGLALLLDAPSDKADGYLAWITTTDNNIRLWTIVNGETAQDQNQEQPSNASTPGPGDVFRVDVTVDGSNLQFDYYVNDVFAGNITVPNPGVASENYAGVILRHNRNNPVEEFSVKKTSDTSPPDAVTNLSGGAPTATSVPLTWTATGDDASTGQASSYDLRYSTSIIDNTNFSNAVQVLGVPPPSPSGSIENYTVSGLQAGTLYFFALKVSDEAGNTSTISNVISATTVAGNFFKDDFNRVDLGTDWTTAPDYAIVNNELSNTSGSAAWSEIAVLNSRKNPTEISYKISDTAADAAGIDQSGFVVVFGSASATSSGYAISRRTGANNEIRLWELTSGAITNVIEKNLSPNLSPPGPGDVVKIQISSDGNANKFDFFINDVFDGRVEDTGFLHNMADDHWAGVTLKGSENNDIDDFTLLLEVGAPANLSKFDGDAQTDTVGQQLPVPLTVLVTDDAGSPIQGVNVAYEVTSGGGSTDVAPPKEDIIMEAELGVLTDPMIVGTDGAASGGSFIHVPDGQGGAQQGLAEYSITIQDAGNYVMWGRAIYPDANADAFKVIALGDTLLWDIGQRNHQTNWTWDAVTDRGNGSAQNPEFDPFVFNFSAGTHIIKFQEGKDGAKLDQFVITKENSGFQPPADQSALEPGGTFTNAEGKAFANLTLGPVPGLNTVNASVTGLGSVTFTATGIAGAVATITKISGDGQTGDQGTTLAQPFIVEVRDAFGNLAVGSQVNFTVLPPGNGTLSDPNPVADASGRASTTLTLATNAGVNQVQVSSPGYTGPDVIFTATANPGAAANIALQDGNNQIGTASTPLSSPFRALVTDAVGVPVAGHDVTFTVTGGGGNFGGSSQAIVQTDAAGIAAATLVLGPSPGATNQAQATSAGLSGSPVSFTATSSEPQDFEAISPLTLAGTASVPLADSIKVRVKDALGQNLPNYPVEFAITLGDGKANGSSSPITVSTGMDGIARVEWRLGPMAGTNNNKLRASSTFGGNELAGSPIEFTASAAVGNAANLLEVSGNSQSGLIETTLEQPFVVRVTDASNNPVMGWPVTFSVQAGGGNFGGQPSVAKSTDSEGNASATLTLGNTAGTPQNPFNNVVQVSAENNAQPLTGSPVTFSASALASGAENLVLVSGDNQSGLAGEPLPQQVSVRVTDGSNNNIIGHPVAFKVTAGGGSLNGTSQTEIQINTNESGLASVTWYLGGSLGANNQNLEVSANDGINQLNNSPMTLQATAAAGPVDLEVSTVASDVAVLQANGTDRATITVTLTDKFENPISGKAVIITATGSNNAIEQPINPTDANGKAVGTIASIAAGVKTIGARVVTDGVDLTSTTDVTFLSEPPERVELSGGDNQTANTQTSLPQPIEVLVTDNFNNPVPGVAVEFEVMTGGGHFVATNSTSMASSEAAGPAGDIEATTTDSEGKAWAIWVLGTSPGVNTAEARAVFNGAQLSGSPISFTANAVAATATAISYHSGRDQINVPAGYPLPEPLEVLVSDASGNPVAGVTVNFNETSGGGTPDDPAPKSDYEGIARTRYTLGAVAGANVVEASNSLDGSPVIFQFESVVGGPSKLMREAGHQETATVGSIHEVTAKITDLFDNAVEGAHLAFDVVQGNATIIQQDNVTNNAGLGSAQVQMPDNIGEVLVRAISNNLPGFFVTFQVTAVSGSAALLVEVDGNNQNGTVDRPLVYPFQVQVTDANGNPVSGHEVQWVRTLGGGSFGGSSAISAFTDSLGISQALLTLGPQATTNEAIAIASLLTPSQITFQATAVTNNFPEFTNANDTLIVEGNLLQFQLNAEDADNDPLTYEAQDLPAGALFNSSTATFTWTPNDTQSGEYQTTFIVRDNRGGLDAETITITVVNSNNPPVITSFTPSQVEFTSRLGDVISFSVQVTDADPNDPIAYTWQLFSDSNPNGQLLSTSPGFDFDSGNFSAATYIVKVTVSDGKDSDSVEWTLQLVTSVELSAFAADFIGFDGVQISWATSREIDNAGFDILRGLSSDGKYAKVNNDLIPAQDNGQYVFRDKSVQVGKRYYYILEDVDVNGTRTQHGPISITVTAPETFELSQNYPNPFNPDTKIRYQLPQAGRVLVRIYDVLGREVKTLIDGEVESGFHTLTWNATDNAGVKVSSGIYYYQIISGDFKQTKKMLLMK